MGEGDYMPAGGYRKKYDPKHAAAIKAGGKKAQQIRKQSRNHHQNVEIPAAEEQLLKDLEDLGEAEEKNEKE